MYTINPLNAELNPICHLLALVGAHHILLVSRIRVKHNPVRRYNCDESGITIVQHKHMTILGLKGIHQISCVQSAERGSLVTVVSCTSPTGHSIPPLLVFPRKYINPLNTELNPICQYYK